MEESRGEGNVNHQGAALPRVATESTLRPYRRLGGWGLIEGAGKINELAESASIGGQLEKPTTRGIDSTLQAYLKLLSL